MEEKNAAMWDTDWFEYERCGSLSKTTCRGMVESWQHASPLISVIQNMYTQGVGEMAQLVKMLLCKHKNPSSDP